MSLKSPQSNLNIVYLDTSILIAIFVHPSEIKSHIRSLLTGYDMRLTGLVAMQEFSRRLLKEAKYLLEQLNSKGSYQKVLSHLQFLPAQSQRKFKICFSTLVNYFPDDSDSDRTDRMKLFLEELLESGTEELLSNCVDSVVRGVGCASACQKIKRKGSTFQFPNDKCELHIQCGVGDFLKTCMARVPLTRFLEANSHQLTSELQAGLKALQQLEKNDCAGASSLNPCLKFGDVLISLESRTASTFMTMNYKESVLLCEESGQKLIICPVNPSNIKAI